MRVAVIGAGASGLTALKACLEEGLDAVCFEKTSELGGLWTYREQNVDGVASVMFSTTTNTSKEMSAFSDFPPPPRYPNYMHHSLVSKYLNDYADAFSLRRHVRCCHSVIRLSPTHDHGRNGPLDVVVRDEEKGSTFEHTFDAVMVCTGYDHTPLETKFFGLSDQFKGRVLHARDYKRPAGFQDSRVLVIGLGNSGCDIAVELSAVADACCRFSQIVILILSKSTSEDSVFFEDDPSVGFAVDVVILATGYTAHFPFIDGSVLPVRDNRVRLYKYVFPSHMQRGTLAFIGAVQPEGSLFPISELQSRWAAGVFAGRYDLPTIAAMENYVDCKDQLTKGRYISGSRHARQVDWIDYMDEVAELVGCKPRLGRLLLTDPALAWACVFGPCLPYQYRLHGARPYPKARQQIMNFWENCKLGLKTRKLPWESDAVSGLAVPVLDPKVAVMGLSFLAAGLRVKALRLLLLKCLTFVLQLARLLTAPISAKRMVSVSQTVKGYLGALSRTQTLHGAVSRGLI
ncbi:hypothetical protein HPB48_022078 [Haemaphysalis longicornis]|uniref:Flavin-containing monooxygenase n=1 Tax=Haemaphysalis longicornis TaxID=44386 RepID=A0A9J6G084_HAELO|nr:hypothetical protein HPB48_022078 [Haemaphysalis longicornis]